MNNLDKAVKLVEGSETLDNYNRKIPITKFHSILIFKMPNGQISHMAISDNRARPEKDLFRIECLDKLVELNNEFQALSRSGVSSTTFSPVTGGDISIPNTDVVMSPQDWVELYDNMFKLFDCKTYTNRDILARDNKVRLRPGSDFKFGRP